MTAIVLSSMRRKLTNRSVLLNLVVMPLLLIVILGNALASTFTSETHASTATHETSLGVVDLDSSAGSRALVASLAASGAFAVHAYPSVDTGRGALSAGDVDVLATVPSGYGSDLADGTAPTVGLTALDSQVDRLAAAQVALDTVGDAARAQAATGRAHPPAYTLGDYVGSGTPTSTDPAAGVTGITYYTVTMLVLILLYGLGNTMNFVKEEYDGPLGDRYLASPTGTLQLVAAQVVSGTLTSAIQGGVVVGAAVALFGADLGHSPLVVAAIVAVAAVLFNVLGLFLGLLGRSRPWLDPLVSLLIPVMTFLGGGFVKLDTGRLQDLTVNHVFQSALFREVSGIRPDWSPLLTCLALSGAVFLASAVMVRRVGVR
ncbi:ABC transporter permease [Phycicoccus flavus]|uniref:ABC transporter permease n=1 Tax=Phycicoccus flavus TaxID=2502783 RepID=UPI000FEB800D|nr:ABC transporter permease [Phycicoccus flavus]NHA67706.1 ABC transporter permease [Phycicoccus flavus]